jgi:hypothetical protein
MADRALGLVRLAGKHMAHRHDGDDHQEALQMPQGRCHHARLHAIPLGVQRAEPHRPREVLGSAVRLAALHRGLRKIIKTRGGVPSEEAAMMLLYLALRNLGLHRNLSSSG